jgi:hypothetical protein
MNPQTIEVVIDKDGNMTIHVQGIKGMKCADITKALEVASGGSIDRQWTEEAFQDNGDDESQGVTICQQ